jgi:nucleoside-diphosphate-sugar epimerase
MKLLVLGGTRFLGRHLVEAALARAMDVTIFTRGRSAVPWLDRVTSLVGDRGPFDATDRFGYWVARFVHPQLLGDRPPRAVVPEPPERPLRFIDARATSRLGCSTCSSATSRARSTRRAPHANGE